MKHLKDRSVTSDDYAPMEERARQLDGLKVGEVVCVHLNNKHIICVYKPSSECCTGCVLNSDGALPCTRWVGDSEKCRFIPMEDLVE